MTYPIDELADDGDFDELDDDDDFREPDPEEFADPSCIDCGGQGGWCREIRDGQCIWQVCDCIDWVAWGAACER